MTEQHFFVVRLESDLPTFRRNGLMHAIRLHPGVECVADLSAIDQQTLDAILLKPEGEQPKKRRKARAA